MQPPQANNNSSGSDSSYLDVGSIVKSGYLKKLKTMRKKFFVIWGATEATSAVLEYYDNEKKFRLGLGAKKAIHLSTCFNINTKSDSKNKFVISLYTRNDMFAIVMEDEEQQNEWLKVLLEQQRASGDGRPIPLIEHIWQVTVKSKGLGSSQNMSGNYRLCLMAGTVHLVKMNAEGGDLIFPLSVVRRCGNTDCFFFMEVGRQAVTGSGEMWMQVEDSVIAHNVHEATLNAMRNSGQGDDMRPRSHSGSTNSITGGDTKSSAGTIPRRNTSSSSWRQRCDSLPVPNRAAARALRHRGSSEGEDGFKEDDYAVPPSGGSSIRPRTSSEGAAPFAGLRFPTSLLKSSKPRPRTSSEGESHFRSTTGHESPNKNRGRHSMPAMRSASVSSGYRPMSVHRKGAQPITNSPPIPNSPLSESPGNFPDERFVPGHSPTDGYNKDDHFFSSEYNNGHMNSLKRSKGRTPDTQSPIREESMESADEYMNMAGSLKSGDELDSYMDMSSTGHTPRSSFSGSIGGNSTPPRSPTARGGAKKPYDVANPSPSGSTPEGYMMMVPSSTKQRTPSQSESIPGSSPSDSTPYMYMSPPVPTGVKHIKKTALPVLPPLVLHPASGNKPAPPLPPGKDRSVSANAEAKSAEGGNLKEPIKERLFDSYANVEFSPDTSHRAISPSGGKGNGEVVDGQYVSLEGDFLKSEYMNMMYSAKKKATNPGGPKLPPRLSNGVGKEDMEESEGDKPSASNKRTGSSANRNKQQNESDYAKMNFSTTKDSASTEESVIKNPTGKEKSKLGEVEGGKLVMKGRKDGKKDGRDGKDKPVVKVKSGPPPAKEERMFEGDFMNVDLSMGSTRLSFPESSTSRGSKVNNIGGSGGIGKQSSSLQRSLEDLQLRESSSSRSLNRLSHPRLGLPGGGTVHPKGSLTPNLALNHSSVTPPVKKKHELNYIDVEADQSNPPRSMSDSSSPLLSPSSPFRGALNEDGRDSEPITYATIDFTKSEGLRNISAMRENRL